MGGWGHLSPVPRLWGWSVCPPPPPPSSSTPSLLPLQIPCSLVDVKLICKSWPPTLPRPDSEELKHFCAPSQFQTKLGNLGWVGGGTYPQSQGCGAGVCAPPPPPPPPPSSSTPSLLPLQIPCSLVDVKLICKSWPPTLPRPDSEELKRES